MSVSYPAEGNAVCFQLENESFWFRHRNACITALVGRFPAAGYIMDVGGGNGVVARALIDAGYRTVLLEPGPDGAENARRLRHVPDVICGTLDAAGLQPASVPAVGLFDVLEHIGDHAAFLKTVHRVLEPGGMVYLTVPAFQWLWSVTDVDAEHFRRYRIADLRRLFEDAGFEVVYATYLFEVLLLPFFLMRTLPFTLGLAQPRTASDYRAEHAGGGRLLSVLLGRLLVREVGAIERGRSMRAGTSCMLVARKAHVG